MYVYGMYLCMYDVDEVVDERFEFVRDRRPDGRDPYPLALPSVYGLPARKKHAQRAIGLYSYLSNVLHTTVSGRPR